MNNEQKDLKNKENYNTCIEKASHINLMRYHVNIIRDYISTMTTKIKLRNEYNDFILLRGIDVINNVYRELLLYTKNIELSVYYTQKGYFYYVEFIDQIGDESNSFLKLNSKDAMLFVLKKTVYEINNDMKKNVSLSESDNKVLKDLLSFSSGLKAYFTESISFFDKLETIQNEYAVVVEMIDNYFSTRYDAGIKSSNILFNILHLFNSLKGVIQEERRKEFINEIKLLKGSSQLNKVAQMLSNIFIQQGTNKHDSSMSDKTSEDKIAAEKEVNALFKYIQTKVKNNKKN